MTDLELYEKLTRRDYSGSEQDQYAQWLETLFFKLPKDDFFKILKQSEKQGKKIKAKFPYAEEFTLDTLFLE